MMAQKRKPAMSPAAFRRLLADAGLNHTTAADFLGVSRRTIIRWASGQVPIHAPNAVFIKSMFMTR